MKEVAEIFDRELFDRFYQRRPSHPMSAEVEKAVDTLFSILQRCKPGTGFYVNDSVCIKSAKEAYDIIFSLKKKS